MAILIESALRVTILAAAVGAMLAGLRLRSPRTAHDAWAGVAAVMLVMPALVAWGPEARVRIVPAVEQVVSTDMAPSGAIDQRAPLTAPRQRANATAAYGWQRPALLVYFVVAAFLLLRIATGVRHAGRLRREAVVVAGRLTHPRCSTPITVGLRHPAIVLPPDWTHWRTSELAAVLAHEAEHVHRRDPLIGCVTLAARAVFWFHPLAWWIHRRVATLAEQACDASVLAQGYNQDAYAALLLKFARSLAHAGGRVAARGTMMPGNGLDSRLQMLRRPPFPSTTRRRLLVASAMYAAAILLASAATPTTAATPPATGVAAVPLAQNGNSWLTANSDHFEIYYDRTVAVEIAEVTRIAEEAYAELTLAFRYEPRERVPLIVTGRDASLIDAVALVAASGAPQRQRIVISLESLTTRPRILVHELTHQFAFEIVPETSRVAPWLIEGLADHQGGVWDPAALRGIRDAVASGWIPDFDALVNSDRYWSHALFDFVADEYGDEGIRRYLFASRTQVRTGDALRTAFGLALDAFNAEFRRYAAARFGGR